METKPWSEIRHHGNPENVARHRAEMEKIANRPWWRLINWFYRKKNGL